MGVGDAFQFSQEDVAGVVRVLRGIRGASASSCALFCKDALSEVMKVLKLKVFVDDITAFMEGRNKELAGIAEKVLTSVKKGGRGEDSISRRRRREEQGDCEEKFQECSKREEAGLATSVET